VRGKLFLGQSIGIDKNNTFNLHSSIKTVGATVGGGLWALEWAWQTDESNLRCAEIYRICKPNPSIAAFIVSETAAFIRTDGHGWIDSVNDPDQEYIYLMGSETLPSTYYIISEESSITFYSTSNGYNNIKRDSSKRSQCENK